MDKTAVKLERLDAWRWRIPRDESAGMRVDGLVFADDALMAALRDDPALVQVANVATLPGIVGRSLAMPDVHWGYGFPIGGVAATRRDTGVISPGGIGFDINCGVRLLRTDLTVGDCHPRLEALADALFARRLSGVEIVHRPIYLRGLTPFSKGIPFSAASGKPTSSITAGIAPETLTGNARP